MKKTSTAKQSTLTLTHISNQTEATSNHSFLNTNHHRIIAQATERTEMSTPLGRFNSGNNGFEMSPTNINSKGRRLLKHNTQSTGMRSHRTSINFTKDRFNSTVIIISLMNFEIVYLLAVRFCERQTISKYNEKQFGANCLHQRLAVQGV